MITAIDTKIQTDLINIFSRVENIKFSTLTTTDIEDLSITIPEINRAINSFGKKDSQTFSKLTTLSMISSSPYGRLKQCLATIEKKRSALKENLFLIQKNTLAIQRLTYKKIILQDIEHLNQDQIYEINELDIKIQEITSMVADSVLYIEGALKEFISYQDAYFQIKKSHNIPDDWNELDYEQSEISEHIKLAFQHAIRDKIMTMRINVGTQEYLEQIGIHPLEADRWISGYLESELQQDFIDISKLYEFLDNMVIKFENEYKKCMKRIGIINLLTNDVLFTSNRGTD